MRTPIASAKVLSPGVSPGDACSQKGRRDQSHQSARWTGNARLAPVQKSSISRSILVRSRSRLAGSTARVVPQVLVFFSYFILQIISATYSERADKMLII